MGWKAVKEYYGIRHLLHVDKGNLVFGSFEDTCCLVISSDGYVLKRSLSSGIGMNKLSLDSYQKKISHDRILFERLFAAKDTFEHSLTVYTSTDDGRILEKQCEELGWPNITHDGCLMFDNQYFTSKSDAVARAKKVLSSCVSSMERIIAKQESELADSKYVLATDKAALDRLLRNHPERKKEIINPFVPR